MNDTTASARALLDEAQDRSIRYRRHLAAVARDLFAPGRSVLSERLHALMSGTVSKLVTDLEAGLRRLLEEALARNAGVLPDSLAALAGDENGAARTVLFESGLLAEPALVEAAWHRARQHLLAAALRAQPAGDDAIQGLLDHANGEIGEATKAYLVEEARRVDSYQEPLLRRQDLDPALTGGLVMAVAAALRRHLLASLDVEPPALDAALETAGRTLRAGLAAEAAPAPGAELAALLDRTEAITPTLPAQVLAQGEVALFEALFGRLSGLAPPRLQRVLHEPSGLDLAVVCRALDLDEATYAALDSLFSQAPAAAAGAPPRTAAGYGAIDPEAARGVLAYWRRDPAYLEAVERIQESREDT